MSGRACVLVFAGHDPSGGAGIAADMQAITALGAHALCVVTALTVQDNNRVHAAHPVEPELVLRQARALAASCRIAAVKIGIPGSAANAAAIAGFVSTFSTMGSDPRVDTGSAVPVVLDPVLASGRGDALGRDDAVAALAPLLACATLVTPNSVELAALGGHAAQAPHVLQTGGHDGGSDVVNIWRHAGGERSWRWPRLDGEFHGSGCTLASAAAALLAQGLPMEQALERAQVYTHSTLRQAYAIAAGQRIPLRYLN